MQEKVVYLTPEGKQRFSAELHELLTVRRHEVEEQIRRAKEFSDTVDNAEYDEAKTEQSFVEGRILELERLLSSAKLIEEPTTKADYVRLGAHGDDAAVPHPERLVQRAGAIERPHAAVPVEGGHRERGVWHGAARRCQTTRKVARRRAAV